jgi:hypothetical protein
MNEFHAASMALGLVNIGRAGVIANAVPLSTGAITISIAQIQQQLAVRGVSAYMPADAMTRVTQQIWNTVQPAMLAALAEAESGLSDCAFLERFQTKINRLRDEANGDRCDGGRVQARAEELEYDLLRELNNNLFLLIAPDRAPLYRQIEPPFGQRVSDTFPDSQADVSAAARCLALDEWTACVMHLMRALERPLHAMAERMGVTFPAPIEFENWKNIIDQLLKRIADEEDRLDRQPKSPSKSAQLRFFAEAAMQMKRFKNAWRNNAAHGRVHYDETDASRAYDAVREFMQQVAQNAPLTPPPTHE